MKLKETLHALFKHKTDHTLIQLLRYTFVGGFAFIVDFSTLYAFTEFLKIHYLISAAIAFILGLTVNYLLSIYWVFNNRTINNKTMEITIFAIIGVVGLGMNELAIWFFTDIAKFHYLISKIFSTVIIYLWNFFARKKILFK